MYCNARCNKLTVGQLRVQHDQVYIDEYLERFMCKSYFANPRLTSYRYVITTFIYRSTNEAYSERSNSSRIF